MQKLALKLDDLNVQSFDTTPAAREARGTVVGHVDDWEDPTYERNACTHDCTEAFTCYTCEESCRTDCDPYGVVAERRVILY